MVIVAVIMMLVLGAVLGLGLGVADKYLKVEPSGPGVFFK